MFLQPEENNVNGRDCWWHGRKAGAVGAQGLSAHVGFGARKGHRIGHPKLNVYKETLWKLVYMFCMFILKYIF